MADDRACLAGNASGSRSGSASLRDGGALLLTAVPCNIIIIMLNLIFVIAFITTSTAHYHYYCFMLLLHIVSLLLF